MAVFAYKGRDARGDLVRGTLEGVDSGAVADQLTQNGVIPTEIKVSDVLRVTTYKLNLLARLQERKIESVDLMLFSRQMHTLLKAGVPIMRALAGLQKSSRHASFIAMLQDLREALDSGRELSTAMHRHPETFSPFYLSMVKVGEMTGRLDETFMRLFSHLEFEKMMKEHIHGALRYPSFVVSAMIMAIVVVNIFVIPAFVKVFAGFNAELPWMTRLLMGFSSFMVTYWPLLLALVIGMVISLRLYIQTSMGKYKWDQYKLHIPIAGNIILKSTLARFSRGLALTFQSGIPIVQGLHAVGMVVDNEFMRVRIGQMRESVDRRT